MRFPRLRIRTLMIIVVVAALGLTEVVRVHEHRARHASFVAQITHHRREAFRCDSRRVACVTESDSAGELYWDSQLLLHVNAADRLMTEDRNQVYDPQSRIQEIMECLLVVTIFTAVGGFLVFLLWFLNSELFRAIYARRQRRSCCGRRVLLTELPDAPPPQNTSGLARRVLAMD